MIGILLTILGGIGGVALWIVLFSSCYGNSDITEERYSIYFDKKKK